MPRSWPSERSPTLQHLSGEASPGGAAACAQPGPATATEELATLYAALDNIENGVLLLDPELRVRYANPALHANSNPRKSSSMVSRFMPTCWSKRGGAALTQSRPMSSSDTWPSDSLGSLLAIGLPLISTLAADASFVANALRFQVADEC
jgi:hypothetical protein